MSSSISLNTNQSSVSINRSSVAAPTEESSTSSSNASSADDVFEDGAGGSSQSPDSSQLAVDIDSTSGLGGVEYLAGIVETTDSADDLGALAQSHTYESALHEYEQAEAAVEEAEQTAEQLSAEIDALNAAFAAAYEPYSDEELVAAASTVEYIQTHLMDPRALIDQPAEFLNGLDTANLPEPVAAALSPILEMVETLSQTDPAAIEQQTQAKE
ncbi:MAG: hypothetical protein AAF449_22270, partial [Myxococcota bacterium]